MPRKKPSGYIEAEQFQFPEFLDETAPPPTGAQYDYALANPTPFMQTKNTPPNITRKSVTSSQIASIGYDAEEKVLCIEFKAFGKKGEKQAPPNTIYHYSEFPKEEWEKFEKAESFGRHFREFIRGRFDFQKQ